MKHKRFNVFWVIMVVTLGLLLVLSSGVVTIGVLHKINSTSFTKANNRTNCQTRNGLEVCISALKQTVTSSEDIKIITTLRNNTNDDITETFGCTATGPSMIVNDKSNFDRACDQAISDKTVKANSSESFYTSLSGASLNAGANTVQASWADYKSDILSINRE